MTGLDSVAMKSHPHEVKVGASRGAGIPSVSRRALRNQGAVFRWERIAYLSTPAPKPGREDEYNRWYNEVHLRDVLQVDGFVGAQRFEIAAAQVGGAGEGSGGGEYLAIYEIEADHLEEALAKLSGGADTMEISDALDLENTSAVAYSALGERQQS